MKFATEFLKFEGADKRNEMRKAIENLLIERTSEVSIDKIVVCGNFDTVQNDKLNDIDVEYIKTDNPTSKDLAVYLGQKILLVSISDFAASILSASKESDVLAIEELDLSGDHVFEVHKPKSMGMHKEQAPVFVETYADFPILFKTYLLYMETIKSLLVLIKDAEENNQGSVREVLVNHLEDKVELYKQRNQIADGLPDMNLEDIKMNLANLFAEVHKDEKKSTIAKDIHAQVHALSRLIETKHEFSLAVNSLSPDLQQNIDKNNLLLATIETELRYSLVEQLREAIGEKVQAINLLGSAAYGAYYEVKESSDVDTEVLFSDKSFLEFSEQFDLDSALDLNEEEVNELFKSKQGKIFETLTILIDRGYIKSAKDALKQFGIFAKLRKSSVNDESLIDKAGYAPKTKIGRQFADYLSYKVVIEGVDVSIHVVPSEVYMAASSIDLTEITETHVLHELRVGKRKKIIEGQKESAEQNFTHYPDKSSFDGDKVDYSCSVSALVREEGNYVLYRPSELEKSGIQESSVMAWVTAVPAVVVQEDRMYHGLFQDKAIWGQFEADDTTELSRSKQRLLVNIIRRFIQEVNTGATVASHASILQLTSRFERIPSFTKRKILLWLQSEEKEVFDDYSKALKKIGSNELEKFGINI
jgi:hypothetical protein